MKLELWKHEQTQQKTEITTKQIVDERPVGLEALVDQYLLQQTRSFGRRSTWVEAGRGAE